MQTLKSCQKKTSTILPRFKKKKSKNRSLHNAFWDRYYLENEGRKGLQGIIVASRHVRNKTKGARNTLPCLLNSDAKKIEVKRFHEKNFFDKKCTYTKKERIFWGAGKWISSSQIFF